MALLVEIIGWSGVVCLLLAYALLTLGRLKAASRTYQGLNILGSIGLAVNALFNRAYPSVATNVIWGFIALYGFSKVMGSPSRKTSGPKKKIL